MKKCKIIAVALLLAMLLNGCGAESEITGTFPTVPEDKQKDVAFTCYNYDFDIYTCCSWKPSISFYLLSHEYIPGEDISVSVPVEHPYEVYVFDALAGYDYYQLTSYQNTSEGYAYAVDENQFQYQTYLYQTSRGMDWATVGKSRLQWREMNDTLEKLNNQGLGDTEEAQSVAAASEQAREEYRKNANTYITEYCDLQIEDLPTFYMYQVEIIFTYNSKAENEIIRDIEVFVGNECYPIEIGEVRLHSEWAGNTYVDDEALKIYSPGPLDFISYPYGFGLEMREGYILRADEDVTLLSCAQLEGSTCSAEILEIYLTISDDNRNGGVDIVWDGKTPIQIPKGKYVEFAFLIQDDRMKEVFYGENLYPTVTYEHNEVTYTLTSQLGLHRQNFEPWFWYAVCFQDLDLQSYFDDYYYYAVDIWRKEYQ